MFRVIADQIGRQGGPTFIIQTRPGAGTIIATEAVSRAAPDGNTVLIVGNSFVVQPHPRKLTYDPLTSFEPICYLWQSPLVFATLRRHTTRNPGISPGQSWEGSNVIEPHFVCLFAPIFLSLSPELLILATQKANAQDG
jgi:hypothetical protein